MKFMLARDGPRGGWAAVVLLEGGQEELYQLDARTPEEASRQLDEFKVWRRQLTDPNYHRHDERWPNQPIYIY